MFSDRRELGAGEKLEKIAVSGDGGMNLVARFEGAPSVELLDDGRNVRLTADLTFYDVEETRWAVPAGAEVDGASIPRAFWSVIGSPLTGPYRNASIIHDWYCDRRTRTWQATHRVFFDAMIVSGVPELQAKIMYYAVRWRGPRWEERVIRNTRMEPGEHYHFQVDGPAAVRCMIIQIASPGDSVTEVEQELIAQAVSERFAQENPALDMIEKLAEDRAFPG
jgi:hypothetical protein